MPGVVLRSRCRAVSNRSPFFIIGQEGCGLESGPEGVAFGGEGLDFVQVWGQGEGGAVGGGEPVGEGGGGSRD